MCVIMIASKVRPSDEMVTRAFEHNRDGAGIAWRERTRNGEVEVVWKKDLDLDAVKELCKNVPMPYVAHFRVASVGGVKGSLTHPFEVNVEAGTALEGRTRGSMLFHNGHWGGWADKALDAAINSNNRIPAGDWSDTRAIAWMVHIYGPGFMEFLTGQKGVLFSPQATNVFTGNGWDKINDVWCSNDFFWKGRSHTAYSGKYCSVGKCMNRIMTGDLCPEHASTKTDAASADDSEEVSTASTPISTNSHLVSIVRGVKDTGPLAEVFTLAEAQALFKSKKLSRSKVKQFQKFYGDLGRGGNRERRAKANLLRLSLIVAEQLSSGSVH